MIRVIWNSILIFIYLLTTSTSSKNQYPYPPLIVWIIAPQSLSSMKNCTHCIQSQIISINFRQYHSSCFAHLQSTISTREDSNNQLHSNIFDIQFNVTKSQTENHILTANTIVSWVILSLPTAIKGIKRQSEERWSNYY